VLVSSAQGLVSPTTLVVDFSSQKLFWLDSADEKIGWANFDGSHPSTQTISILGQVSAMTVYKVRIKILEIASMIISNCLEDCRQYVVVPTLKYAVTENTIANYSYIYIRDIFKTIVA